MKNYALAAVLAAIAATGCTKEQVNTALQGRPVPPATMALKQKLVANGANWMQAIPDSRNVSQLSIPGTHDSGAMYETLPNTAKCQNLTIAQQLEAGIRFLDIRCRHFKNAFEIHHGAIYQHQNFSEVLTAVHTFLAAHPSETVLMSIKQEHTADGNNTTFEQRFNKYVAEEGQGRFYLDDTLPVMGKARGKIILVRRFAATGKLGINTADNWVDSGNSAIRNNAAINVQDQYKVTDNNVKWNAITAMEKSAAADNSTTLYLNFCSGYKPGIFSIPNITTVSNDIDGRLTTNLESLPAKTGVMIMDFSTADLAKKVYAKN